MMLPAAAANTAWLLAGVLSTAIGVVQVFAPEWADGNFIARTGLLGRAVGNLRQPNHLSSLLLWSAIAVVPLLEARRLPRVAAGLLMGYRRADAAGHAHHPLAVARHQVEALADRGEATS